MLTVYELRSRISKLPRVSLGHFPTPIEFCPRLTEAVGGPRIFIKRDDCTGLAFGGNKTRQLEFTVGQGVHHEADVLIGGAGSQSNHCRQLSAAAAKLGLECRIAVVEDHKTEESKGNLLLDDLLGASVQTVDVPTQEELDVAKEQVASDVRSEGKNPFVVMKPENRPYGAMGYALAVAEMSEQMDALGERVDAIVGCSGSCTQPGMIFGNKVLGLGARVYGIAPIEWSYDIKDAFLGVLTRMVELLGVDLAFDREDVWNSPDYIGSEGYGYCSEAGNEALRLMATTEGVILDPIYTGKALSGLIDLAKKGELGSDETVVFLHTGGTPALFAYTEELLGKA
ncbi:MAG: D-cysteine desulfhydrase [Gemmatimonadetes bacterium]|nr:D-cysteine desulfhydrase [Gemmatimonadota bacterium]